MSLIRRKAILNGLKGELPELLEDLRLEEIAKFGDWEERLSARL